MNGSRLLQNLSTAEDLQKKINGSRMQSSLTNILYTMVPYSNKFNDKEAMVLLVDKYGSLLVNIPTEDIYQVESFENQAALRNSMIGATSIGNQQVTEHKPIPTNLAKYTDF